MIWIIITVIIGIVKLYDTITRFIAREKTSFINTAVYKSIEQHKKAVEYYKKHLRICQETGDLAGEAISYGNIGIAYRSLGQYKEAMVFHKKQLCISLEIGAVAGEGISYNNIGLVHQSLCQYQEAMEYHKKHLAICQETCDVVGEGISYNNIGIVHQSLGQYQEAMEYHKKHLAICQETCDVAGEGRAYANIGIANRSLGQYKEAMEFRKKQLRVCLETGDVAGEGRSYCNIGNMYQLLGQYEEAMTYHKKSLRISNKIGDVAAKGRSYNNIGNVYQVLGQYEEAMTYYMKDLCICQETGDVEGEGLSYGNIGLVYQVLGKYEEAMEYHKKALRICQKRCDVSGQGRSCNNIGTVYQALHEYEHAMDYYKEDLRICKETGDVAGEGRSYCNICNAFCSLEKYKEAMEYHRKHLRICKETGDVSEEGVSYSSIGVVYQGLGKYEEAMEYHKKALRICQKTGNVAGEGKSYYHIGNMCFLNGDKQGAEDNLKESLRCFEEVFKFLYNQDDYKVSIVDTYIVAYRLLTDVLIASGKKEEALLVSERGRSQALKDKLTLKYGLQKNDESSALPIANIRSLVSSSNSSFIFISLSEKRVSIYVIEQGNDLYFREQGDLSFAIYRNSECSGKMLPETLKWYVNEIIEDANKYINANPKYVCEDRSMNQDMCYDQQLELADPLSVDSVARATTPRKGAAEENSTTRMSRYRREPTEHSDTAISQPQIDRTSSGNSTPAKQQDVHNGNNLFNDLYQVLIAPVREALNKPEIVIIPDGPLFFVPFAALKQRGQSFLSETKRIRIGPSLTTLKLLKECPIEKHCKTGALIVGGPITGEVMFRGEKKVFSDLPYAREEALMIGDILDERPIIGRLATKDEVKRRLQHGVAIIHISTHSNAVTGELLLAPGPCAGKDIPDEEDYMLTLKDIYASEINAQLVVLSCCHSGHGKIKAEGVVGLTRAFLAAGARSVLASLWAVDDAATSYFMWHFYQYLKSGESACASLQHAMKEMRKSHQWSHPYCWAPFFIVGDDIRITTTD